MIFSRQKKNTRRGRSFKVREEIKKGGNGPSVKGSVSNSMKLELILHRIGNQGDRLGQTGMSWTGLSSDMMAEEHSGVLEVTRAVFLSPGRCCTGLEGAMEWGI